MRCVAGAVRRRCAAAFIATLLTFFPTLSSAGDALHGADLYSARCGACHSINDNGAGPRHRGLFGRRAGTQPGYAYSAALKNSGIIWTATTLDRWLANPGALVPGNKMVVQLASDEHDRADLIAYLHQAAGSAGAKSERPQPH